MASEGSDLPFAPEWVAELAASGAICERCGGIHQTSVDQLILALRAKRISGLAIPWCTCVECSVCQHLDEATATMVRRLIQKQRARSPTTET